MGISLPAIPWSHESSEFGSVWVWETNHFIVTVNGDQRSCYYQISDKSANPGGSPKPLADGQAATFEQAERLIRGTIGKAYDPRLGYQTFAGPLATTFQLGNHEQVDLGIYSGQQVEVTVMNADGSEETYEGTAQIQHYDFLLESGPITMRITPTYITSIKFTNAGRPVVVAPRANRTIKGKVEGGCTGRPGFLSGTVEHTGLICPVHEENI